MALNGEVMRGDIDVINTCVVSMMGGRCSRKQEVSKVIDSWLGVVVCCVGGGEDELEGASWNLWVDGAADCEAGASEHLKPLLLDLGDPVYVDDWWRHLLICKHRRVNRTWNKTAELRFDVVEQGVHCPDDYRDLTDCSC